MSKHIGPWKILMECRISSVQVIDGLGVPYEITLRWMSQNLTDDKSTLAEVMAWCRQMPSHYLSQC